MWHCKMNNFACREGGVTVEGRDRSICAKEIVMLEVGGGWRMKRVRSTPESAGNIRIM